MCGVVACRPGARLGCPCRLSPPGLAGYPPSAHCCAVLVCGNLPCTCESSTLRENEIARGPGAGGRGARRGARGGAVRGRARATCPSPPLVRRGSRDTTTSIFLSKITRMIVARQSCHRSVCTHAPGQLRPELRPLVRAFHDAGTLAPPDTTTKSSPRGSGGSGSGSGSPSARSSSRIAAHSSSACRACAICASP